MDTKTYPFEINLTSMPLEILVEIFLFLRVSDAFKLGSTCRSMYKPFRSEAVWKLYVKRDMKFGAYQLPPKVPNYYDFYKYVLVKVDFMHCNYTCETCVKAFQNSLPLIFGREFYGYKLTKEEAVVIKDHKETRYVCHYAEQTWEDCNTTPRKTWDDSFSEEDDDYCTCMIGLHCCCTWMKEGCLQSYLKDCGYIERFLDVPNKTHFNIS